MNAFSTLQPGDRLAKGDSLIQARINIVLGSHSDHRADDNSAKIATYGTSRRSLVALCNLRRSGARAGPGQ